jgi:hypothetical protein
MVTIKYRLIGDPAFQFKLALEQFAGPEMDNIHKQVAIQLTTEAKRNLEQSIERPWESGNRSGFRLTGALTGKHGRKAAIQSRVINRGDKVQAKGVGFPDIDELNRRARHWRRLEFGDEAIGVTNTMPAGLFLGGTGRTPQPLRGRTPGDTFILYGEYARRSRALGVEGTRRAEGPLGPIGQRRVQFKPGQRTAAEGGRGVLRRAGPVSPIKGKHFLQEAWDFVAGPQGQHIIEKYETAIRKIFGPFEA